MNSLLTLPRRLLLLATLLAIAVIGSALGSQYIGGLEPCKLCHWQRNPYYIGIPLMAITLLAFDASLLLRRVLLIAITAIFLVGVGLGFYHVGVEQGWWPGPVSCTSSASLGASLDEQIENLFNKPRVDCGEPVFVLFGISMAGYNAILSLVIAGLTARAFTKSSN